MMRILPGLRLLPVGLVCCFLSGTALGQVAQVRDLVAKKDEWPKLAQEQKRIQLEGRFDSRAGDSFKLDKMDVIFRHPSTLKLPDRIRKGQRIEVSGNFAYEGSRIGFLVNRMLVRDTDVEHLERRAGEITDKEPERLIEVAAEFVPQAEFYGDDGLHQQISEVRSRAVTLLMKQAGSSSQQLVPLLARAKELTVKQAVLEELTFRVVIADLTSSSPDFEKSIELAKTLKGWDRGVPKPSETVRSSFSKDAVTGYAKAIETDRTGFHRMLYVRLRTRQLQASLKSDGSNGLELAKNVRAEFPDEVEIIKLLEEKEVAWHLSRSGQLGRQDLIQVVSLLNGLQRSAESTKLIQQWLREQEGRFGTTTLAGILRTADEYLFVAEQWRDVTARTKGTDLLKSAWDRAGQESPDDAPLIADRLRTLGWEHLKGQWMTTQQIEMLPQDDIQLAIREGRVVRGMTGDQVAKAFGKPLKISRIASSRVMRELWLYEEAGLVVRLHRSLARPAEGLIVEDVARTR